MTYTFRPARRENVPLLLGVAGGTGSGKTYSALLLARGIAQGQPFAFIDTENGRGLHYADAFPEMQHTDMKAPFRPERYTEAIADGMQHLAGIAPQERVVVVDSFSHEWTGDGGCLDWVDEITGGDQKKNPQAWAKVKPAHRRMMTKLLALEAHLILCFRAEYGKVDIVRRDGKTEFVPKKTLPGGSLDDWYPETAKAVPYELTASFLVVADAPGVPRPLKLQEQHRPFVPLDRPLDESVGRRLAEWAAGSAPVVKSDLDLGGASGVGNGPGTGADSGSVGEPQAGHSGRQAAAATVSQPDNDGEVASPTDIVALVTALVGASQRPDATAAAIENHAAAHPPEQHYAWLMAQAEKKGVVVA